MIADTLVQSISHYTNLPQGEVSRLLALSPDAILEDADYLDYLNALDAELLEADLPAARDAFNHGLQEIADAMQAEYALDHNPMSSYTLGNWLVGFAEKPEQLAMFQNLHSHLPKDMMVKYLNPIVTLLDDMQEGREQWQHALALFTITLIAGR